MATLSDAQSGLGESSTGSGNATAAIVTTAFSATYTEVASIAGNGGPGDYIDGLFKVTVSTGSWGSSGPLTGTWTLTNSSFWTTYGNAAISMRAGGGQGTPDHFISKLTNETPTGLWAFDGIAMKGGGLSDLKLYGNGTPSKRVHDGGTTAAALGFALLGLSSMRKLIGSKA